MQIKRAVVVSVLAFVVACKSDTTSPTSNSGAFSFNYSGSASGTGTFSASGILPTIEADIGKANAAAGHLDTQNSAYDVVGIHARGAGRYDIGGVTIARTTVGSSNIDPNCNPQTTTCTDIVYVTNVSQADANFDLICVLGSGTVTITEITSTRVKGTFAGLGLCTDMSASTFTSFTLTGGTFDVPLVASVPGT